MHKSVLTNEIIENLGIREKGTYIDLTLGAGGHSREILKSLKDGRLVVFDVDQESIIEFGGLSELGGGEVVETRIDENTVYLVNRNFEKLEKTLVELEIDRVDGVILDLGWSTDQLKRVPGLSYTSDEAEPLDMRFDQTLGVSAADLLNGLHKKELLTLFAENADIVGREARDLVQLIIKNRPIHTNQDLNNVIESLGSHLVGALRPRVFQALRIAVNNELSTLQSVLPQAWNSLGSGGRLLVITFHSGEDRIVKNVFRDLVDRREAEQIIKGDFLRPGVEELRENLRARSAKLRGIQKK